MLCNDGNRPRWGNSRNQMISNILDPAGYAVWMVPVVSARVPAESSLT